MPQRIRQIGKDVKTPLTKTIFCPDPFQILQFSQFLRENFQSAICQIQCIPVEPLCVPKKFSQFLWTKTKIFMIIGIEPLIRKIAFKKRFLVNCSISLSFSGSKWCQLCFRRHSLLTFPAPSTFFSILPCFPRQRNRNALRTALTREENQTELQEEGRS